MGRGEKRRESTTVGGGWGCRASNRPEKRVAHTDEGREDEGLGKREEEDD